MSHVHMTTFDAVWYDITAPCTYVMLRDNSMERRALSVIVSIDVCPMDHLRLCLASAALNFGSGEVIDLLQGSFKVNTYLESVAKTLANLHARV